MLKKIILLLLVSFAAMTLLTGCKKQLSFDEPLPVTSIDPAQVYYTQFSLFQEKNKYRTTNYRKGILVPINTAVTLVEMTAKVAVLRLVEGGQTLTIENVPKHTIDDMQTAFEKIAKPSQVSLRRFSAAQRDAILSGRAIKGMNREAVIAAIGYPPQHQTPSLQADDWLYWGNRFNRFIVHFKKGRVDKIVE